MSMIKRALEELEEKVGKYYEEMSDDDIAGQLEAMLDNGELDHILMKAS